MERFGEHTVLIFGLALVLAVAGIAGFPCWRHSRHLGYGPSLSAGVLLLVVALLALGHKAEGPMAAGPTTAREARDMTIAAAPAVVPSFIADTSHQPIPLRRSTPSE
jgi:hypothetical protein